MKIFNKVFDLLAAPDWGAHSSVSSEPKAFSHLSLDYIHLTPHLSPHTITVWSEVWLHVMAQNAGQAVLFSDPTKVNLNVHVFQLTHSDNLPSHAILNK